MPKKEELKKLVRGKGLEALRPSAEDLSTETKVTEELNSVSKAKPSISSPSEEKTPASQAENTAERPLQEKRLNEHCVITEIVPSTEQQTYIHKEIAMNSHQIIMWDTFVSQGEKRGSAFNKDAPIAFHVCCAASGLLEQLKPDLKIYWITYDLLRCQTQPGYEFSICTKPWWSIFKVSYEIQPALKGFFKYHIILDIEQTDLFWSREGAVFKIS